jgi:hypothetical protein
MANLKKVGFGITLIWLLLVGVAVVPVSAQPATKDLMLPDDQNPSLLRIPVTWEADTVLSRDSSNKVLCKHYSTSKTDDEYFPIDTIGVRANVWKNGLLKYEKNLINHDSGIAELNYNSGSESTSGTWTAKTNHIFEAPEYNQYQYPQTEDTLSV